MQSSASRTYSGICSTDGRPSKQLTEGTREVAGAVFASTMTTLVVFFPVLLIEQQAGQLFRDIALAIMAAVGLSLIISLTMIPSAAGVFLKARKRNLEELPRERRTGVA